MNPPGACARREAQAGTLGTNQEPPLQQPREKVAPARAAQPSADTRGGKIHVFACMEIGE